MARGIFAKQANLKPAAMRTVAERRFGDAEALRNTNENARANGVAYLAGFVIEILLKAKLAEKSPNLAGKSPDNLAGEQQKVWSLIWKQHDLEDMLLRLPELKAYLQKRGERDGENYLSELQKLCGMWTIHARYSPLTMRMREASDLLDRVRKLKELLK